IDAPLKLPIPDVFTEKMINDIEHEWGKVYTFRPYEDLIFNKKSKFKASGRTFSSLAITYRAQILRIILEMRGWRLIASPDEVIDKRHNYFTEVFPHLTLNILGIKLGKKRVRYKQKQEFVKDLFKKKIYGIYFKRKNDLKDLSDKEEDVLDAIICGWTGVLFLLKKTICFGDKKYGFVICPYTKEFEEFLKINAKEKPYFYEIFSPEAY
ncbi:MAG: DUF429 domain-containing protein, partial [Syntrophorhabdaceae bacterium]|nr:DUF429 domain-containing protein [Syntrophorhabdaceae bacterium]